jgi:predicted Rossmann fold flavoprotein
MTKIECDVLILGGGAAGLMCANVAGSRHRRVVVLERNPEPGRKILISGGGRCNFTNLHCQPEQFLSANPHFAKSALARYTPHDFIRLVEKHGIRYHEKTPGQLFCDRSARQILEMLTDECRQGNAEIRCGCEVSEVSREDGFAVTTNLGTFSAPSLVVATGGLSIPKMGATDLGYRIAKQFGLRIVPCRPALVPLAFAPLDRSRYCELAGISLPVVASTASHRFREKMLITHRGLSGPAILQISSYWRPRDEMVVDLLPDVPDFEQSADAKDILARAWPRRFQQRWLEVNGFSNDWQALTRQELARLSSAVHSWTFLPQGTEGFEKAEVTAGGVDTHEISSRTMEARRIPGLYFIGEVLDVTGQLGGFNFQWAWSSGYAAGQAV